MQPKQYSVSHRYLAVTKLGTRCPGNRRLSRMAVIWPSDAGTRGDASAMLLGYPDDRARPRLPSRAKGSPMRLSIKAAAAAAVAAALLGPAGLTAAWASAPPGRSNATVVCGGQCLDLSSTLLGPGFIQNASDLGGAVGTDRGRKVNLRRGGDARTNEDFVIRVDGFVRQFCGRAAGDFFSPTSYQCLHYRPFPVFEANFAPDSNESGYCAGVGAAAQGFKVRLEPCGASARTLWIG